MTDDCRELPLAKTDNRGNASPVALRAPFGGPADDKKVRLSEEVTLGF